jgi:hypothetical protein
MRSNDVKLIHVTASSHLIQTAISAIPKFNWPGSIIPPSILEKLFSGGNSEEKKAAPGKAAAPVKKDMTWGGRPDPNPEMYVEEPKPKKGKK